MPLKKPQAAPTSSPTIMAGTMGSPASNATPVQHPERHIIDAMEISISPKRSTIMVVNTISALSMNTTILFIILLKFR